MSVEIKLFKHGHVAVFTHEQVAGPPKASEEQKAEWRRREAEVVERRRATLAAAPEALRPIIDLHSPDEFEECKGCDCGNYAENNADWPCSTIDLIVELVEGKKP